MAMYHANFKIIGRSTKRNGSAVAGSAYITGSVVAGVAYRTGGKIKNEYDGKTYDYTHKSGVVHTEIMLPEGAPERFSTSKYLWSAVEIKNNRSDAQLARECDLALPIEFTREEQIETVREYIRENLTSKGICAEYAIHDKGDGNPHVHIIFTMDKVTEKGFGKRLDEETAENFHKQPERLKEWRRNWAEVCNRRFIEKRLDIRIDHRTYEVQGIDKIPTIHLGKEAHALEKKGVRTERGDINRQIIAFNETKEQILQISTLTNTLTQYKLDVRQSLSKINTERITVINELEKINAEMKEIESNIRMITRHSEPIRSIINRKDTQTIEPKQLEQQREHERPFDRLLRGQQERERPSREQPLRTQPLRERPSRDRAARNLEERER